MVVVCVSNKPCIFGMENVEGGAHLVRLVQLS